MTTYNTGNPVPSGDARDRFDNSQTLDEVVSGSEDFAVTRLGKQIKTLRGVNNDFNAALAAMGYESAHLTYVVGQPLSVARSTQLIDYNGSVYRVKLPASFPVNLTGVWATDATKLVDVGDASIRQALSQPTGASMVGYNAGLTGTVNRTVQSRLRDRVSILDFEPAANLGIVPIAAALRLAIIAVPVGGFIDFPPGRYNWGEKVTVNKTVTLQMDGVTVICPTGSIFTGRTLEVTADDVIIHGKGLVFEANDTGFVILTAGKNTRIEGAHFKGKAQKYIFSLGGDGARRTIVSDCFFDGGILDEEVGTAVEFEGTQDFRVLNCDFKNLLLGWGVRTDGASSGVIIESNFKHDLYSDSKVATSGQTVFTFTMPVPVRFTGLQVNGHPLSKGYTKTQVGNVYTLTFSTPFAGSALLNFIGFRGAENIQVNENSLDIKIIGCDIDGTGDSGMTLLSDRVTVIGTDVKNCAYAGIAGYGGTDLTKFIGCNVSNCSQFDDGLTSPDDPNQSSVFCGGILLSGVGMLVDGCVVDNTQGTMKYGIRYNAVGAAIEDGSGDYSMKLGGNAFKGSFELGKYCFLQDNAAARAQSVWIEGAPILPYFSQVDLDGAWTGTPVSTSYWAYSKFGATGAVRDAIVNVGAGISLRTVAGQYVDMQPVAGALMKNSIIRLSFLAKANTGESYVSVFTTLSGGSTREVRIPITDTSFKRYTLTVPFADNIVSFGPIRVGAETGDANFQLFYLDSASIPR